MANSSIQVSKAMRRRLAAYKLPGMSYEDVLDVFTAAVPPAVFKARYAAGRAQAARDALAPSENEGDPAEGARIAREARWRAMQPIELMEEAFAVSQLVRELA